MQMFQHPLGRLDFKKKRPLRYNVLKKSVSLHKVC